MGLNAFAVFEVLVITLSYSLHLVEDGVLDFFSKDRIIFESVVHLVVTRGSLAELLVEHWIIEIVHYGILLLLVRLVWVDSA